MQSSKNAVSHTLHSTQTDQQVELMIEQGEGAGAVALRYSTWIEGLGWCSQKTIRLDSDQLDDLHRAITVVRHRLNRQRAEAGQLTETAQVIQLPMLA